MSTTTCLKSKSQKQLYANQSLIAFVFSFIRRALFSIFLFLSLVNARRRLPAPFRNYAVAGGKTTWATMTTIYLAAPPRPPFRPPLYNPHRRLVELSLATLPSTARRRVWTLLWATQPVTRWSHPWPVKHRFVVRFPPTHSSCPTISQWFAQCVSISCFSPHQVFIEMLRAEFVKVEAFHQHLTRQLHAHYADFLVAVTAPGMHAFACFYSGVFAFFFVHPFMFLLGPLLILLWLHQTTTVCNYVCVCVCVCVLTNC